MFLWAFYEQSSAQVPPRPEQPHPDVFDCGVGNCQTLNPVTRKAKADRTASYRLITMPGCVAGTIPADLVALEAELQKVGFRLVRDDTTFDFTTRINCGTEQARICGSVTIFCLNRGFPYTPDVEISDILSSYPAITRLSILCHEICGHAIATWNEQYCVGYETTGICKGLTRFTSAPGWIDFMNTGPNSRHGIEIIERERWERTMYRIVQQYPFWANGRWWFANGRSTDPAYGNCGGWYNAANQLVLAECADWGGRYVKDGAAPETGVWLHYGTPVFTLSEWWDVIP